MGSGSGSYATTCDIAAQYPYGYTTAPVSLRTRLMGHCNDSWVTIAQKSTAQHANSKKCYLPQLSSSCALPPETSRNDLAQPRLLHLSGARAGKLVRAQKDHVHRDLVTRDVAPAKAA